MLAGQVVHWIIPVDLYVPGLQAEIINVKLIPPTFSSNNKQSLSIFFHPPLKKVKVEGYEWFLIYLLLIS